MKAIGAVMLLSMTIGSAQAAEKITIPPCPTESVEHKPAADVEYQAGSAAGGGVVAPADLSPPPIDGKRLAEETYLPLAAPVSNYVDPNSHNIPLPESTVDVGVVTLKDGKASLNGRPLTAEPGCK